MRGMRLYLLFIALGLTIPPDGQQPSEILDVREGSHWIPPPRFVCVHVYYAFEQPAVRRCFFEARISWDAFLASYSEGKGALAPE